MAPEHLGHRPRSCSGLASAGLGPVPWAWLEQASCWQGSALGLQRARLQPSAPPGTPGALPGPCPCPGQKCHFAGGRLRLGQFLRPGPAGSPCRRLCVPYPEEGRCPPGHPGGGPILGQRFQNYPQGAQSSWRGAFGDTSQPLLLPMGGRRVSENRGGLGVRLPGKPLPRKGKP